MVAYLDRMPAGIPGDVTRQGSATLEPNLLGAAAIAFGAPVKMSGGKLVPVAAGDAATDIYGLLARTYPTMSANSDFGAAQAALAPADSQQSVLRRGYMSVLLKAGTAAKNGPVYVRVAAAEGKAPGDIEAAPGEGLVALAGGVFMGGADAGGNVEISYNI